MPLYPERNDRPAIIQCLHCGRTGRFACVLVERHADCTEEWRCSARRECSRRVKRLGAKWREGMEVSRMATENPTRVSDALPTVRESAMQQLGGRPV